MKKRVLITGLAGFIGFHAAKAILKEGIEVQGIDNFNDYYTPELKKLRMQELPFSLCHLGDIKDAHFLKKTIEEFKPTHILHLAAQAGVRYSLVNPHSYIDSNITGFLNILEILKEKPDIKLVFASTSSVYGNNKKIPFEEDDYTEDQANLYGVTKKCNELMAKAYHHLYGISAIGLRFFTVYGPWGRPDMAYFSFTDKIFRDEPIVVFGEDQMRDFTYVDDIVAGILKALEIERGFELFNLGNNRPVPLMRFISIIEEAAGKKARIHIAEPQKGDVKATFASIEKSRKYLQFEPKTILEDGIPLFVDWYKRYREHVSHTIV